jgi:hypothetical protein
LVYNEALVSRDDGATDATVSLPVAPGYTADSYISLVKAQGIIRKPRKNPEEKYPEEKYPILKKTFEEYDLHMEVETADGLYHRSWKVTGNDLTNPIEAGYNYRLVIKRVNRQGARG